LHKPVQGDLFHLTEQGVCMQHAAGPLNLEDDDGLGYPMPDES